MASSVMHLAVAKKVNEVLKKDENKILLGAIAPDLSKIVGEDRIKSHFLMDDEATPNLAKFLEKYRDKLNDDFILGYYIHIYTDYLWVSLFLPLIIQNDNIKTLDGQVVKLEGEKKCFYIYNDYTTLNGDLIKQYNLNLQDLNPYEITSKMDEIDISKLDLLVEKVREIYDLTKEKKLYIFDLTDVNSFIEVASENILTSLKMLMPYMD